MKKIFGYLRYIVLKPFSIIWSWVYQFRRTLYLWGVIKSKQIDTPVISVGNLSFGGTGKTPLIIWLTQYLNSINKKVLVLSRGYKSKFENGLGILEAQTDADPLEFGDEAVLVGNYLKDGAIVVGRKRFQNLTAVFKQINPDVILLDDGFQHLQIARDLEIVLIDSTLNFSRFETAPLGYLREPLKALRSADITLFSRFDLLPDQKRQPFLDFIAPHLGAGHLVDTISYKSMGIFRADGKIVETDEYQNFHWAVIAAIAKPQSFVAQLEREGLEIEKSFIFSDHYHYKESELQQMATDHPELVFICTEKDFVKLKRFNCLKGRLFFLKIEVQFTNIEAIFKERVLACLN